MKSLIWENKDIKLVEKACPQIIHPRDAIVKVALSSICTSDLHIKHGFVPLAKQGITLGHEFVGEIIELGSEITNLKVGDRLNTKNKTYNGRRETQKRANDGSCRLPNHHNSGVDERKADV